MVLFKDTTILAISQLFPLGGGKGNPEQREAETKTCYSHPSVFMGVGRGWLQAPLMETKFGRCPSS